jgi:hypothetical protein
MLTQRRWHIQYPAELRVAVLSGMGDKKGTWYLR